MRIAKTTLLALLLVGCAEVDSAPFSSQSEELAAEATNVNEAALGNCPRPCILTGATREHSAIDNKLTNLDPGVRDAYFTTETTEIAKTPNNEAHGQFFAGWAGAGAIYTIDGHGTYAIYGSFLDEWAARGFERGLLYFPSSDAYVTDSGMRQDFFVDSNKGVPNYSWGCHLETRRSLIWDRDTDETRFVEESTYFDSNHPLQPASKPQPVTWYWAAPARDPLNQGLWDQAWCGEPPGWLTGQEAWIEEHAGDPDPVDPRDI